MNVKPWIFGLSLVLSGTLFAQHPKMEGMQCPMMMKSASVEVSDITGGISITSTGQKADISAIRQRVKRMATMKMQCCVAAASAAYEAVPNGARLTLKPKDAAELGEFQKQVREHMERMKDGDCCQSGSDCCANAGYCPMHKH